MTGAALLALVGVLQLVRRRPPTVGAEPDGGGDGAASSAERRRPSAVVQRATARLQLWLAESGLVRWRELGLVCAFGASAAFAVTWLTFGGLLPALMVGMAVSGWPVALYRSRRARRLAEAQEAWPRIIEEVRLAVTGVGTAIPTALFAAGARAPALLREGFEVAQRTWTFTTDFAQALAQLKAHLRHPTADAVCETLLAAHEVGGVELDGRLRDLADDRLADLGSRKDARSKQAGARFARLFVLLVPAAMALMGLGIGRGRAAYQTTTGQLLVAFGVLTVVACWVWASSIMRIPPERRTFAQ